MGSDDTQWEPSVPDDYPEPPREDHAAPAPAGPAEPARSSSGKKFLWVLVLVALAFLAGFGWQYYRAMTIEDRLERTEQELAVERLRVGLAQAAVAAQSGDYEAARRQMSDFFTATQRRLEELPPDVRPVAEELLRDRDQVITGLSRENYEYATILYEMLQRFQTSLEPAGPAPARPESDTGPGVGG